MHHHRFSNFFSFLDLHDSKETSSRASQTGRKDVTMSGGTSEQQVPSETLSVIKEAANRQWRRLQESGVETSKLMELAASILKSCGSNDANPSVNGFEKGEPLKGEPLTGDWPQGDWNNNKLADGDHVSESSGANSGAEDFDNGLDEEAAQWGNAVWDNAVWCDEAWDGEMGGNLQWSGHWGDDKSTGHWSHDDENSPEDKTLGSLPVSTGGTINLQPNTNEPLIVSMEAFFRFSFDFSEALNDVVEEYSSSKEHKRV